ncbi:MAG: heavy-metal-associated domain-containing protein [Acholeplasmatales bacterium]|nr:heavy-metal-associated domain-containing protein [Acholeplasmatales bacterium]
MTKIIRFKGIDCANCAAKVEKKLNKMKGVNATISFAAGKIMFELDDESLFEDAIQLIRKEEPDFEYSL